MASYKPMTEAMASVSATGNQPLLEESVANSRRKSINRLTEPCSTPMKYWTNTDVVMWLLQIDQKVFVPAAILRNISGKTLLDLKFEQLGETMNLPKDTPPQDMQSLNTLFNHIEVMRAPTGTEGKVMETWGTDETAEETYGRLIAHPSGWTYDREYNEWIDYLELFGENAITINIEANLKDMQSYIQLMVLVASAISSLITSIQMSTTAEQHQDGRRLSHGFQMTVNPEQVDVIHVLNVVLPVTTFFVTTTSGYALVCGSAWKEQLTVSFTQLMVLVASAISSFITFIQMSTTAEQHQVGRRLSHDFEMTLNPEQVDVVLKVILLLTTFFVTITSGYAQVAGPRWKQQLAATAEYQSIADKLLGLYEDNLSAPLDDRLEYTAYQAQVRALWVQMSAVRIDASPQQRNSALRDIKERDPTTWKKAFEFQEVGRDRCQICGPRAMELSEPVGDAYDYMLMRFSGEDMGEYTSKPETFKADKAAARQGLVQHQKLLGSSVQSIEVS